MITIRRATAEDRAAIAAVHVASIRGLTQNHYTQDQIDAWSAGKDPAKYPIDEHLMFVATDASGTIVGFSELNVAGHEVRAVYVAPASARSGVGSRLLGAVEAAARDHGLRRLALGASLNAYLFYRKHGFKDVPDGLRTTVDGAPYRMMEKAL